MFLEIFKALVYTAVFSLLLTPLDFGLARAIGAIDIPADGRRMHTRPIPRLGGISLFASFIVFSLVFCGGLSLSLATITLGSCVIVALGVADDSLSLSAKKKLAAQSLAAMISASAVIQLGHSSVVAFILATLWILTLTNAHNFIDGLDGLCAGVSLIEACAIGVLFLLIKSPLLSLLAFILGGACIGFLPYNDKKAKLFMGDTGSAFLGFIIGILSFEFMASARSFTALLSILLVLLLPISDIVFAVTRRIYQGKSIFESDRSHIHHILADRTLGHRGASVTIRVFSLISAVLGVVLFIAFDSSSSVFSWAYPIEAFKHL